MSTAPAAPASTQTKMVTLTIDGKSVTVPEGTTIFDAAATIGIDVPVLCHKPPLPQVGICRVCCCEVKNKTPDGTIGPPGRVYAAACMRTCSDNMVVTTTGEKRVDDARKTIVELLLSEHPQPCERHKEYHDCELEVLAEKLGITPPTDPCAPAASAPAPVSKTTSSAEWARVPSPPSASTTTSPWAKAHA